MDDPLPELYDVASADTLQPLDNYIVVEFHFTIPGFNHIGNSSYAILIRPKIYIAVFNLLAHINTLLS
jgi:hypothetical protein